MEKNFLLIVFCLLGLNLSAQMRTVAGQVKDNSDLPLIGVNILVKGTDTGTVTDFDGNFSLEVPAGQNTLVLSYTGYIAQEVDITNTSQVEIVLQEDVYGLEEVVVVGYGTQKKVNLTGSVEQVNGDQLARQPVMQTSQALTGLSPGLTAIQSSGQPGADNATLRIRGGGSIGASNDPLVLIDGVEGDINGVDPNDIENISVLKDASAAAIYGSRASNGVILVTTKRAKEGSFSVNYNAWLGTQKPTTLPEFVGVIEYLNLIGTDAAVVADYQANLSDSDNYPDTDWVNELFTENGFQQYHNISVNGGSERVKALASVSFMDQSANVPNYNFKRYNVRLNTDIKANDRINLSFDLNFRRSDQDNPNASLENVTRQAFRIPPDQVAIHSDGSWGDGWQGQNPVAFAYDGGTNLSQTNYFRGVLRATVDIVDGLKFTALYSPEFQDGYFKNFNKQYTTIVDWNTKTTRIVPAQNSLSQSNQRSLTNNVNALLTYDKTFGNHGLSLLAGYEAIKFNYEAFGANRRDFILDNIQVLNAGSQDGLGNNGTATQNGLVSFFGRANYAFKDKYLLEANIRRDASSRFAADNRVAIFPSFSVGWRVSQEDFFNEEGFFSDLKLRASWGRLGNQQIGDFPYVSSISLGGGNNYIFNDVIYTGAVQSVLANNDIRWETSETTNFGADIGFMQGKFTITADYFIKNTDDLLLVLPIPLVAGLSPAESNAASTENKGFDLALTWRDKIGAFNYGLRVNYSDVVRTATDLAGVGPLISGNQITQLGGELFSLYGLESQGIFQSQAEIDGAATQAGNPTIGDLRYVDQNSDGLINSDDRVIIGNPFPRHSYGIELFGDIKGFDLSVFLNGVGKRDVLLLGDAAMPLFNAGKIQRWHVEQSWSESNTGAEFPRIFPTSNNQQVSSTWVFDASYLRVRNITIGYTVPASALQKVGINSLRIYASGQNLFTSSNLPDGLDPLIPNGSSGGYFPVTKATTFGLNVNF
jgi:TonB-linked SusC/RagA family outer membrane protein